MIEIIYTKGYYVLIDEDGYESAPIVPAKAGWYYIEEQETRSFSKAFRIAMTTF
jgi:hypothetical protein